MICMLVAYFIYERVVSYTRPSIDVPGAPLGLAAAPANERSERLGFEQSSLAYSGAIAVLRLSGQPQLLGIGQGRLLGDTITAPMAALGPSITYAVPHGGVLGDLVYDLRLRWRYRFLDDGIPGHQLVEIAGILHGMRRTSGSAPAYEGFVRAQAALDVGVPPPWASGAGFRTMARSLSFITSLRGTSGDRLLVGRTLALPGAADGGDAAAASLTVSFVEADSVIPFASVGWPGLVGVVSGINAEGVAVMVHPVRTSDISLSRPAQPATLLARDVLENAHNLDEAVRILQHGSPLGAAAFLVVDGNARSWAVVERSPTKAAVIRDPNVLVVTDVLAAEQFGEDPDNDRAERTLPSSMRARRVKQLLRERPDAPDDVAAILRDRRSTDSAPLPPGHRGAVHDVSAVHTAIFDASGMVLWVADGGDASGRFRAFDLRYELRGEGARPAPPADLPADMDVDDSIALRVRRARHDLRAARQARADDHMRRARELVQRALAGAPNLPEALLLAGDLARAARDREIARQLYQRFLEAPDDQGVTEEIRALISN